MRRNGYTAAVFAMLASPALAQTAASPVNIAQMNLGYTYFNRPGATVTMHDKDLTECMALARDARSVDTMIGNTSGLLGAALSGAAEKGVAASGTENCMVVKGWRVVQLPETEGEALATMPLGQAVARITPWLGAEKPEGAIVRVWGNDAARASTKRYAIRPAYREGRQLSVRIRTSDPTSKFADAPVLPTAGTTLDPKWPKKPLKVEEIASVSPEAMIIVTRIKGISMSNGTGLVFARMGQDRDKWPSLSDHGPDLINPAAGAMFAKKQGNWFIFAVPAGRWRIAAMGGIPAIDFCLGGPSFEGRAGEVVYAGGFDLGAEDVGPDLSLDDVKAFLVSSPALEKVRAADYTNGAQGQCFLSILYALEVKGAPFLPDYKWGGAYSPAN